MNARRASAWVLTTLFICSAVVVAYGSLDDELGQALVLSDNGIIIPIPRAGSTIGEALRAAGIMWNGDDRLFPEIETPLAAAQHVFLERKRTVTVHIGTNAPQTLRTFATTVAAFLVEQHIPLSPIDRVQPGRNDSLPDEGTIVITRVSEEVRREQETIPPLVVTRNDDTLPLGTTKIEAPGAPGQAELTVFLRTENGTIVERRIRERKIVHQPTERVVRHGTKIVVLGTETGRASWFRAASGTIAHRSLPFGSRVRIVRSDTGATAMATVADRGPFLPGRIVDLSADVFQHLAPLSTGTISVRVEHLK